MLLSTTVITTLSGRDTMKHMCDTESGSSGAPVLDRATGHVVGLHWGGVYDEFNYMIAAGMIVDDLAAHAPGAAARLTVAE